MWSYESGGLGAGVLEDCSRTREGDSERERERERVSEASNVQRLCSSGKEKRTSKLS